MIIKHLGEKALNSAPQTTKMFPPPFQNPSSDPL
jgi:hypothetical protein